MKLLPWRALDMATVAVAACALVITLAVIRRELVDLAGVPNSRSALRPDSVLFAGGRVVGQPEARVTVVEFIDYQCPYCRSADSVLRELRATYPAVLRLSIRHFPMTALHRHARQAALAAECAAEQGRFDEFTALLLRRQDSIGVISWASFARRSGVPAPHALANCVVDERYAAVIQRDITEGHRFGVSTTPTFVIGTSVVEGMPPGRGLTELVTAAVSRAGVH